MNKKSRIIITGGSGLVGKALANLLIKNGFKNIFSPSSKDCNLINKEHTESLFKEIKPEYVFHLAAKVYGIGGNNKFHADVLYENVMINTNIINSCKKFNVKKVVCMGSGCVYPDLGAEELYEDSIWLGPPHQSEAAYAHSKRLMLSHLEAVKNQYGMDYVFSISGNIYGPFDSFDIENGHVTPSLIHKFYLANKNNNPITIWGSGKAIRDFSHSSDIAKALLICMNELSGAINIASGNRNAILEIVNILSEIYDNEIEIRFDSSKPDGQMARFYNIDKLKSAGFKPEYSLKKGILETHNWFIENYEIARK